MLNFFSSFTSRRFAGLLALGGAAFCALGTAHADTINFTTDTTGGKPNGFISTQSGLVSFTDSSGADLQIQDWGIQSHGNGLAVFGDDPSFLVMNFSTQVNALSLGFGNDDPGFGADRAVLTAFLGGTQVGQTTVLFNNDDIMNQTIGLSGFNFDRATFSYNNATGLGNLIEIVDDINFTPAGVTAVPEPSEWLAMGMAGSSVCGLMLRARRRKTAKA